MKDTAPARAEAHRVLKLVLLGLAVAMAAIVGTLGWQSVSWSATWFGGAHSPGAHRAVPQSASSLATSVGDVLRGDRDGATTEEDGAVTEEDGALRDGVTVFDDEYPGISNLKPELLQALREAASAADDGIAFEVNSGWRSPDYQNQLLREAVSKYGSERDAARWVGTANTSAHVSGDAIDIGPFRARVWLSKHGATYGLCQIYRNEPWHYELRPEATSGRCPRMFADPTHDPRMGH